MALLFGGKCVRVLLIFLVWTHICLLVQTDDYEPIKGRKQRQNPDPTPAPTKQSSSEFTTEEQLPSSLQPPQTTSSPYSQYSQPTPSPQQSDTSTTQQQNRDQVEGQSQPFTKTTEPDDPEALRAITLYEEGEKILARSNGKDTRGYELLWQASEMNHTRAAERVAFALLFSDFAPFAAGASGGVLSRGGGQRFLEARRLLEKAAETGSPRAQLGLGFLYATGIAVNSSQAKALVYYTFAAHGGDPLAQMALGYRYWSGLSVDESCEFALSYYRRAAQKVVNEFELTIGGSGPAIQRVRLADEYDPYATGGTSSMGAAGSNSVGTELEADVMQYYEFIAERGADVSALLGLGQVYLYGGRGIQVDHNRAFNYFQRAANQGNPSALAYLGKMYMDGTSATKQNNETAFTYFLKAAESGNPLGLTGLGLLYLLGRGVPQDYSKAIQYFTKGVEQGSSDAHLYLGAIHYLGLGVPRNLLHARKYFELAAQTGHLLGVYNLAELHATGTGVYRACHIAGELYKNVVERGKWGSLFAQAHTAYKPRRPADDALIRYMFLAELGYEVALSNAAFILDRGETTLFDQREAQKRAFHYWERAAAQGSLLARIKLGDYYYYGTGTAVDMEKAATEYRLAGEGAGSASALGLTSVVLGSGQSPLALYNLGCMHEAGEGLKRDLHLAKRYYDMALEYSSDAAVPVAFALARLQLKFFLESLSASNLTLSALLGRLWYVTAPRHYLGKNWDVYLVTAMLGALGMLLVRRHLEAQERARQRVAAAPVVSRVPHTPPREAASSSGTASASTSASASGLSSSSDSSGSTAPSSSRSDTNSNAAPSHTEGDDRNNQQ